MNTKDTAAAAAVTRPTVTLMMVLCGAVGASMAGSVVAATPNDDVPRISVRYDAKVLGSDDGARVLYRRIVNAAERVCPDMSADPHFVSRAAQICRNEAILRAVRQIDNPRLAAIHDGGSKSG